MTDDRDDGTDRRSLLVGAAVGAAASLAAGSASAQPLSQVKPGGTHVVVDLGGVTLPEEVARQLGDSVRRTVLEVLAGYDSRRSMVVLPHVKQPGWNGIWVRWADNFQLPEGALHE